MKMKFLYTAIITIFLPIALSQSVSKTCWRQICRECGQSAEQGPGLVDECNSKTSVNKNWLEDPSPIMPIDVNADFVCLKMTASNPKIIGDSTDVIRGCVVKMQAENVCSQLSQIQQGRNKNNVRCVTCEGDNCNSASIVTASGTILSVITVLISKFLLY